MEASDSNATRRTMSEAYPLSRTVTSYPLSVRTAFSTVSEPLTSYSSRAAAVSSAAEEEVQTAEVTRRNISSELSESSSLEPKDTYEVTSLVEGEIIACYFEEGD